jgi:hypothetical protein
MSATACRWRSHHLLRIGLHTWTPGRQKNPCHYTKITGRRGLEATLGPQRKPATTRASRIPPQLRDLLYSANCYIPHLDHKD